MYAKVHCPWNFVGLCNYVWIFLNKDIDWLVLVRLFNCLTWFKTHFAFASGDTCRLQESQGESDVQKERRGARRALYVKGGQFCGPKKHVHLCCFCFWCRMNLMWNILLNSGILIRWVPMLSGRSIYIVCAGQEESRETKGLKSFKYPLSLVLSLGTTMGY